MIRDNHITRNDNKLNNQRLFQSSGLQILQPQQKHQPHVQSQNNLHLLRPILKNKTQEPTKETKNRKKRKVHFDKLAKQPLPHILSHISSDFELLTISNPQIFDAFKHIFSFVEEPNVIRHDYQQNPNIQIQPPTNLTIQVHSIQGNFYTPNPVRIATFIVSEDDIRDINIKPITLFGRVSSAIPLQQLIMQNNNFNNQIDSVERVIRKSFQQGVYFEHFSTLNYYQMKKILKDIKNSKNPQQKLKAIFFALAQKQQLQDLQQLQNTQFNKYNCFNDHKILAYGSYELTDLLNGKRDLDFTKGKNITCYDSNHQPLSNIKQEYMPDEANFCASFEDGLMKSVGKTTVQLQVEKEEHEDEGECILKNLNIELIEKNIDEIKKGKYSHPQQQNKDHQKPLPSHLNIVQIRQPPIIQPQDQENHIRNKSGRNNQDWWLGSDQNNTPKQDNFYRFGQESMQIIIQKYNHGNNHMQYLSPQNQYNKSQPFYELSGLNQAPRTDNKRYRSLNRVYDPKH